jgi:hypothetical protein
MTYLLNDVTAMVEVLKCQWKVLHITHIGATYYTNVGLDSFACKI